MNKRFQPEEVRVISQMLKKHGIGRMGFLLLGGPGETRETVQESLAFADSLDLESVKVTAGIRIYPHTTLAQIALNEKLITPHHDLLLPTFYLAKGLGPWLHETIQHWLTRATPLASLSSSRLQPPSTQHSELSTFIAVSGVLRQPRGPQALWASS